MEIGNSPVRPGFRIFPPPFFRNLEADAGVHDEETRSGRGGNAAERVVAVDGRGRVSEVRVIQDVDRIQPEFEIRRLAVELPSSPSS